MPTMMLPSQNCLKRAALLIFIIYCSLTCSSGFQVVPAFRKQRNRRQLPFDVEVNSSIRRRTSLAPLSPIQGNNNAICMSGLALRNRKGTCSDYSLNLYRQSVNDVLEPQRSPLFEHYHSEFRLMLSSSSDDDDNKSPSSGKLRSFISKVFKSLVSPAKRAIRWIRNKLKKTDKFLEETIEEQESAVVKAIKDIEARASEIAAKGAAVASEQSMLEQTETTAPEEETAATKSEATRTETPVKTDTPASVPIAKQDTETVVNGAPKEPAPVESPVRPSKESITSAAPTTEQKDLLAQEQEATAEAQIEIVEKVEAVQTKDAAMAAEEGILADLDKPTAQEDLLAQEQEATAEAQIEIVEKVEAVQTKDAAMAAEEQILADLDNKPTAQEDLLAQEQEATAEAQIDVVEKVEAVQTKDAAMATEERMFAELDKPEASDADIMSGMAAPHKKAKTTSTGMPIGDRWAIAAPGVDLSGDWKLVVTDEFKSEYDEYLKQLGQPFIVRSVALTLIGLTTEHTEQKEEGRTLFIRGTNARGVWERTLVTSGADRVNDQYTPLHVPVETADDERVEAEAWWEDDGKVHLSWMRGLNKYGGGGFESKRYLDEEGKVLVCESTFHPNEKDRKSVGITWRFLREGGALYA